MTAGADDRGGAGQQCAAAPGLPQRLVGNPAAFRPLGDRPADHAGGLRSPGARRDDPDRRGDLRGRGQDQRRRPRCRGLLRRGDRRQYRLRHRAFGGRALALRFGKYVFLTEERLDKAERFFDRRGSIVITFARFVEGLRQANGIIAGITGMHWLRFVIFNAIGAALWVGTWITIGYFAGNNITTIYHYITLYSYYVLAGLVVLIVGYIVWRRRRRRRRAAASAAGQTDEAPEGSSASEAAEPSPDQHGPARAVPDEQETEEIAPAEQAAGPSVPGRHAPEQPSRRQGS